MSLMVLHIQEAQILSMKGDSLLFQVRAWNIQCQSFSQVLIFLCKSSILWPWLHQFVSNLSPKWMVGPVAGNLTIPHAPAIADSLHSSHHVWHAVATHLSRNVVMWWILILLQKKQEILTVKKKVCSLCTCEVPNKLWGMLLFIYLSWLTCIYHKWTTFLGTGWNMLHIEIVTSPCKS